MGNTREVNGNAAILARINKGWKPNRYLTNMSMAYFADPKDHVATSIFPICPVDFSTGFYYEFLKGDLARDNVARKRLSVKYHRQRWDTLITATNAL